MTTKLKHKLQTLTLALATISIITALAGCGQADAGGGRDMAECTDLGHGFSECVITLRDTRRVVCIDAAGGGIGLSCDWTHVDGGDDL
ncbi:hypothetical protein CS006_10465 [Bifidobacterium primatium]|uniref:DUF333 domain-containing protein n=2 Tax=Bifidobacterium TaxID=1678 RepID=A0A2M9H6B1_9BIFI|nr:MULTISPECIES: hypothetical protein [Bifidobacterium]NEG95997.1 hypothetical protein [Bifidobacterium sp. SMB2]NEH12462.1 hypothetical protein [Bifidobacterium saimiriisciurei]PJM72350.1 hypothetical protein CS006_10465 [Bifidobacterium primatium]